MITIRLSTPADAALIADISRQTFYDTFARYNTADDMHKFMEQQFSRDSLINEAKEPANIFLLAFEGATPAGYAFLRERRLPAELEGKAAMEIARIYAIQSFIGKGIGKKLMEECIAIALQKSREILWLGVWEHNSAAISFYQKWGFEKFSSHTFVLGDDEQVDWLMKKNLRNSI